MKRDKVALTVNLSKSDFKDLQAIADEYEMLKSDYVRLLIQGQILAHKLSKLDEVPSVLKIGGYGYEFDSSDFKAFLESVTDEQKKLLNAFADKLNISYNIGSLGGKKPDIRPRRLTFKKPK